MANRFDIRRREFLTGGGSAIVGSAVTGVLAGPADAVATPVKPGGKTRTVLLHQGTDMALALSPDHRTLAIDAVGVLWTLPIHGGSARQLTEYPSDHGQHLRPGESGASKDQT